MPYFVRLVPAVLWSRECRIQKNSFPIRKVESLERGFPDRINEQHRPFADLDSRNADPTDRLTHNAWVVSGVKPAVKLQQFAHILQPERGLGMTQPPQHTLDTTVDVASGLDGDDPVLSQMRPFVTSVR